MTRPIAVEVDSFLGRMALVVTGTQSEKPGTIMVRVKSYDGDEASIRIAYKAGDSPIFVAERIAAQFQERGFHLLGAEQQKDVVLFRPVLPSKQIATLHVEVK